MALNKVNIPVASGAKTEMDLSCNHQTSMNFLLAQPVFYRHMPRGEHFTDSTLGVVRPVAMFLPTFGRIRNNIRAFFVPYRLIMPQYDAMRADVIGNNYTDSAIPLQTPRIDNDTIINYFLTVSIANVGPLVQNLGSTQPSTPYDFTYGGNYYNYTAAGRRRLKLLRALGYEPIYANKSNMLFDILGLLAYAQIYLDWYANAQYLDSNAVLELKRILSYNDPTTPLTLSLSQFSSLVALVFNVVYDTDEYFNAAWDVPVAPTTSQNSLPIVSDVTVTDAAYNSQVIPTSNNTPVMAKTGSNSFTLGSQYIHDMLQALTNYQRRHALSGAREIDRALADFGFVSDYQALKRAVYIGNRSFDIQIGDVFSTADTSNTQVSNLGDFAGRGFGNGQGSFDFTASEDGVIIIVSTIIPSAGIVQGYDRNNRHLTKYDFFDPNFEIGVQVIEKGEVYVSKNDYFNSDASLLSQKFGYTGRFGEYKRPRDWWTSESRCPSVDAGGEAWNLFRLFSDDSFANNVQNIVHSLDFTRGVDWETFNRIFNYTGSDRDKFDCFYHHEVHVQTPMKPLFETYDFKEDHKRIKMDINGSKVN